MLMRLAVRQGASSPSWSHSHHRNSGLSEDSDEAGKSASVPKKKPLPPVKGPVPLTVPGLQPRSARTPRGGLSTDSRSQELEGHIRQAYGQSTESIRLWDVLRNPNLKEDLAELPLTDYFNEKGAPLFGGLSLSFAAKQTTELNSSFGNWVEERPKARGLEKKPMSARSYFLACEAVEKDIEMGRQRVDEAMKALGDQNRCNADEVRQRQLQVIFGDTNVLERTLPSNVQRKYLQCQEALVGDERENKLAFERHNQNMNDQFWRVGTQIDCIFTQKEALVVAKICSMWTRATHGPSHMPGMDRPTFCRMLLDLGLIDQDKVPYHWAVSLFDEAAKPLRCGPPQPPVSEALLYAVPQQRVLLVISDWHLVVILSMLVRQLLGEASKRKFIASLLPVARLKLPAHVWHENGVTDSLIRRLGAGCEGTEDELMQELQARSAMSSEQRAASPVTLGHSARADLDWCASASDMRRLDIEREQLLRAMMVEPEVLHLLAQHENFFVALHRNYSGDAPHLSRDDFLQLCQDFRLTPVHASPTTVAQVYSSVLCLDLNTAGLDPLQMLPTTFQEDPLMSAAGSRVQSQMPSPTTTMEGQDMVSAVQQMLGKKPDSRHGARTSSSKVPQGQQLPQDLLRQQLQQHQKQVGRRGSHPSLGDSPRKDKAAKSPRSAIRKSSSPKDPMTPNRRGNSLAVPPSTGSFKVTPASSRGQSPDHMLVAGGTYDLEALMKEQQLKTEWPPQVPWKGIVEVAEKAVAASKKLKVVLEGARGLRLIRGGEPDTFCTCLPIGASRQVSRRIQTRVVRGSVEPQWKHEAEVVEYEPGVPLQFAIWAKTAVGEAEPDLVAKVTLRSEQFVAAGFAGEVAMTPVTRGPPIYLKLRLTLDSDGDDDHRRPSGVFGPGALTEALCRLIFTYLGWHGNTQQQSMDGLMRVVWMLAHLRNVFEVSQASLVRRTSDTGLAGGTARLRRARTVPLLGEHLRRMLTQNAGNLFKAEPSQKVTSLGPTKARKRLPTAAPTRSQADLEAEQKKKALLETIVTESYSERSRSRGVSKSGLARMKATTMIMRLGMRLNKAGADKSATTADDASNRDSERSMPGSRSARTKQSVTVVADEPEERPSQRRASHRRRLSMSADRSFNSETSLTGSEGVRASVPPLHETPNAASNQSDFCVVDGVCQVCQGAVGDEGWGSPHCHGCSVVDTMPFRSHLLRALLLDYHPDVKPAKPPVGKALRSVDRSQLTPPPLPTSSENLRN